MAKYDIRWIPDDRVTEVVYNDVSIHDDASFDAWTAALTEGFDEAKRQAGGKFPLMVDISGLKIASDFGARYSELAVQVAREYATVITRYGHHAMTGRVVAVEAMRRALRLEDPTARARQYAANIFESRDEAIKFIRMLEEQGLIDPTGS